MTKCVVIPEDVFDRAGSWISAALDCEQTCQSCKDDFLALLATANRGDTCEGSSRDAVIRELIEKALGSEADDYRSYDGYVAEWLKDQLKGE